MDAIAKLNELWQCREELARLMAEKEALVNAAIPEDVRKRIAEIELEFAPMIERAQERATALENEIKALVIRVGESVKGARLQAVFGRRANWDTKGLEGYAVAHPEVLALRREEPYVSIRNVK